MLRVANSEGSLKPAADPSGTPRKMPENLAWAVDCSAIPPPITAGVFKLALRVGTGAEVAVLSMSGQASAWQMNALLKRLGLSVQSVADSAASVRCVEHVGHG